MDKTRTNDSLPFQPGDRIRITSTAKCRGFDVDMKKGDLGTIVADPLNTSDSMAVRADPDTRLQAHWPWYVPCDAMEKID